MESQKGNNSNDVHTRISQLIEEAINKWQDEYIRNMDSSKLTKDKASHQLYIISHAQVILDILLTQTEELGGFGSFYPKKCLELLKTMQTILQMEIDV